MVRPMSEKSWRERPWVKTMGATLLKTAEEKKLRWYERFAGFYERMLRAVLNKKAAVLTIVTLLLALSIFGALVMGTSFLGNMDSPQMSASVTVPKGSTREETYAMNDKVMDRILEIEAVETVGAMSGGQSGLGILGGRLGGGSGNGTTFYILLREDRSQSNKDVERLIYEKTADLDAEISVSSSTMDITMLGGSGIQVNIKGQDLDTLAGISKEIAGILSSAEGTGKISTALDDADKETRIIVDKDKAMREGLTVA
jgi:HAE1 family hydrophobic/amphiphilic exporter-1